MEKYGVEVENAEKCPNCESPLKQPSGICPKCGSLPLEKKKEKKEEKKEEQNKKEEAKEQLEKLKNNIETFIDKALAMDNDNISEGALEVRLLKMPNKSFNSIVEFYKECRMIIIGCVNILSKYCEQDCLASEIRSRARFFYGTIENKYLYINIRKEGKKILNTIKDKDLSDLVLDIINLLDILQDAAVKCFRALRELSEDIYKDTDIIITEMINAISDLDDYYLQEEDEDECCLQNAQAVNGKCKIAQSEEEEYQGLYIIPIESITSRLDIEDACKTREYILYEEPVVLGG